MAWSDILGGINSGVQSAGGWGNVLQGLYGMYGASREKKAGKKAAGQAARAATPVAYSTGSMYGTTQVDPRTRQIQYGFGQNPFAQLMNVGGLQSLANAYSAPGGAYGGAAPEIAAAAQGLTGPGLETEAAGRLGILRQLAQPEEQRATNQLTDRLFASGRLGGTGGGIEQEAMARAQSAADLQRQLASQDWASTRAQNRFQGALQAVGAGQAGAAQQFNMGMGSQGGLADMFKLLLSQGGQGIGAATGTPSDIAALQYGANMAPGAAGAGLEWLKKSGMFTKIGDWMGGKLPGGNTYPGYSPPTGTTPPYVPPTGGATPGPWGGGYVFPQQTQPGMMYPYGTGGG